jgi:hypothetical protein
MKKTFLRALRAIETTPFSLGLFATTFLALILARLAVEVAMHGFGPSPFSFFYFEFSHTFLFFLCAYLVFVPLIAAAGKIRFVEALPLTLFGFLIILTPPVIDTIIFRGGTFWSFYEFDGLAGLIRRFFTFFGSTPDMGITWGVRVEVALASLASTPTSSGGASSPPSAFSSSRTRSSSCSAPSPLTSRSLPSGWRKDFPP